MHYYFLYCFRIGFSEEDATEMAYLATPPYLKLLASGNSRGDRSWKLQDWTDLVGQLGALVRQTSALHRQGSSAMSSTAGRRGLRALKCEALAFLCSSAFEMRVRDVAQRTSTQLASCASPSAPVTAKAAATLPALQLFLEYLLEKLILLALEQPATARVGELSYTDRVERTLAQVYHENNLPIELAALIGRLNQRSQKRFNYSYIPYSFITYFSKLIFSINYIVNTNECSKHYL